MKKTNTLLMSALLLFSSVAAAEIPAPPDVAAPPAGAERTESGLATIVLTEGTGEGHPSATDIVKVHYTGWTTDGKMFDSSVEKGQPVGLPLDRVIKGWSEGLQLMVVGEKRRMWIPEDLAYGGMEGRPAGMLVFDVDLLGFNAPPQPPPAPHDVAGPPSDAEVTKSGLASRMLEAGSGTEHPRRSSTVTVHYSGWTTDGRLFDSSIMRGKPAAFGLDQVIKGWTEGLQLMVIGETRRFWIPEDLAYKGQEGRPAGMLVFDVKLLSIN
ncbi:MAG: FKBP-type peptidyl-prolyl cis-trans isomerase [Thermoanaerobaculia bacterium]